MEEKVELSKLQKSLFRIGDLMPGLGFDEYEEVEFCDLLAEIQDEADRVMPDAAKLKNALGQLRELLKRQRSATATALAEIDKLARSIDDGPGVMGIDHPTIIALREQVTAAEQEFNMAIAFHEVWKPTVDDKDLHRRLGTSYATQAFLVARTALRREMLLALMRLWDSNKQAVRMTWVRDTLTKKEVIDALALDRASRVCGLDALDAVRDDLGKKAESAVRLIKKYMVDGERRSVLENLVALRNERLAHRQLLDRTPAEATGGETTDKEIEEFYQDCSKLIEILLSLVKAVAYDPRDTGNVFGFYAREFWGRVEEAPKRVPHLRNGV